MVLLYKGMLGPNHSWSNVSSSLLLEFQKQGIELICQSTNDPKGINPALKVVQLNTPVIAETSFSYTIPPNIVDIKAKNKVVIQNHDNNLLPKGWVYLLNTHAALILPSSQFAYDILKENGVFENKMAIVPHGYNPQEFYPEIPAADLKDPSVEGKFKFLCVAAPHWRKGHDILLKAFIEEFKDDEDVVLIIKSSMNSHEVKSKFHIDFDKLVKECQQKYKFKWPQIRFMTQRFEQLGSLYKAADAVVLPSRTECFSLTCLESAMVKVPVITTEYGGHLDYLNHDNSYLIDYVMKKCPPEGEYYRLIGDSFVAEPDKEHLKQLMRHVKNNKEEVSKKVELAYEQCKHLTWESAATQVLNLMKERNFKL
jgi:glycosyltransferase involved in cell wall biosynthesis